MVYLYHFNKPYHRAQHYLGSTCDLERRNKQHRSGHGSPLIRAAIAAGCTLTLIPLYPNDGRSQERAIKGYKNSRRICPVCNPL